MTVSTMTTSYGSRGSALANLPSLIFWGGSTALTGNGVYHSLLPVLELQAVALVVAVIITSALTFTGYKLFRFAGLQHGKTRKPAYEVGAHAQLDTNPRFRLAAVCGGLVVLLLSSWFSFSSLVFLNFNAQLQRAMNDAQQATLIAPVRALERSMARIEQDSVALSAVAARRANVEAQSGGQCVASGRGRGPIAEMIDAHAADSASLSASARILRQKASAAVEAMRIATTQEMANAAYAQAQEVMDSDARGSISAKARELRNGYDGSGFLRDGRLIYCPRGTAAMVPALERVLEAAEAEIDLPASPPVFRRASLLDSASRQLEMVRSWGANTIPGMDISYLLLFAFIALGLDISGAATAFFAGRIKGACLSKAEREALETTAAIMEDFIWDIPKRYQRTPGGEILHAEFNTVLVMPTEEDSEENAQILRAVRRFASAYKLSLDRSRAGSDTRHLTHDYGYLMRRLQRNGLHGEHVCIYNGPSETWEMIREHRRILRLLFGQGVLLPRRALQAAGNDDNITEFRQPLGA